MDQVVAQLDQVVAQLDQGVGLQDLVAALWVRRKNCSLTHVLWVKWKSVLDMQQVQGQAVVRQDLQVQDWQIYVTEILLEKHRVMHSPLGVLQVLAKLQAMQMVWKAALLETMEAQLVSAKLLEVTQLGWVVVQLVQVVCLDLEVAQLVRVVVALLVLEDGWMCLVVQPHRKMAAMKAVGTMAVVLDQLVLIGKVRGGLLLRVVGRLGPVGGSGH